MRHTRLSLTLTLILVLVPLALALANDTSPPTPLASPSASGKPDCPKTVLCPSCKLPYWACIIFTIIFMPAVILGGCFALLWTVIGAFKVLDYLIESYRFLHWQHTRMAIFWEWYKSRKTREWFKSAHGKSVAERDSLALGERLQRLRRKSTNLIASLAVKTWDSISPTTGAAHLPKGLLALPLALLALLAPLARAAPAEASSTSTPTAKRVERGRLCRHVSEGVTGLFAAYFILRCINHLIYDVDPKTYAVLDVFSAWLRSLPRKAGGVVTALTVNLWTTLRGPSRFGGSSLIGHTTATDTEIGRRGSAVGSVEV
ncbi:uncharacterized protein LOC62_06G007824 [Vanrija pseudolonga]|uniref:Uncharacterized protein n=1 Tax=Vanrija pseudolonga TaxID=143232 RepID=A0AAF0YGA1_9TREE|nr:hypothetical protein LOC62_06G007824 [Vanrija pseudolonga]